MNDLAVQQRLTELLPDDITSLDRALAKMGKIVKKVDYGSKPVFDDQGNWLRSEHDVIYEGVTFEFTKSGKRDERVIEAIVRVATKPHIIAHLTRLSSHCRDNRGKNFSWVLEDIASDVYGVSEWAVIKACEALRAREKWFPVTSQLVDEIKKYQSVAEMIRAGTAIAGPVNSDDETLLPWQEHMQNRIGQAKFKAWFKGAVFENDTLHIPTDFCAKWIKSSYPGDLRAVFGPNVTINVRDFTHAS